MGEEGGENVEEMEDIHIHVMGETVEGGSIGEAGKQRDRDRHIHRPTDRQRKTYSQIIDRQSQTHSQTHRPTDMHIHRHRQRQTDINRQPNTQSERDIQDTERVS